MPKYELAICVVTEPNHRTDTKRKDEGDIIAIRPYPWNWGVKEIDECLIVIIETARSYEVLRNLIRQSVYKDKVNNVVVKQGDYEELTNPETRTRDRNEFEMAHKNRFQISHAKVKERLSDLNLTKVRDKLLRYQPFKNATQLVQKFDGLNNNRFLQISDVDCHSIHANNNAEFSINLDNIPAVILDKYTGQLVKP